VNEPTVKCPKCGTEVKLTETLAAPMVAAVRAEYESRVAKAEQDARTAVMDANIAKADVERDIKFAVDEARVAIEREAKSRADAAYGAQFSELDNELLGLRAKLGEAQQAQAQALRKERDLEERERALELTLEQRLQAALTTGRVAIMHEAEERNRLKLLEKDTLLQQAQIKMAELQQKLEQGSQQSQGEVQEEDLKARLSDAFRVDTVGDVAKGVCGADLVQSVIAADGTGAGVILYESKRTKTFSQAWLAKLREDGRAAKADVLVLVTQAMPKEVESFECVEGVWLCQPKYATALAGVLREALLRVHATKLAQAGQETKAVLVYRYMTGNQFRQRVEAITEAFTALQSELDSERKAMARIWAKRETQLERAMVHTAGLFGDLQGLSGRELADLEGLSLVEGA